MSDLERLTADLLRDLFPACKEPAVWAAALREELQVAAIDTTPRIALFLAHAGHECGGFTTFVENLNYRAEALTKRWPHRFPRAKAERLGRIERTERGRRVVLQVANQEGIAEAAYGGRLGNGPEGSGDGWKFRGHGIFQLTGRENYEAFAKRYNLGSAEAALAFVQTPKGAVQSAVWYWMSRGLNAYADKEDLISSTLRINGGLNGLDERTALFRKAKAALSKDTVVSVPQPASREMTADELNDLELRRIRSRG